MYWKPSNSACQDAVRNITSDTRELNENPSRFGMGPVWTMMMPDAALGQLLIDMIEFGCPVEMDVQVSILQTAYLSSMIEPGTTIMMLCN